MFFKLLSQALCKLKSSHSKTWCKTEEWSHKGRISGTYGHLKFRKWTKGKCISTCDPNATRCQVIQIFHGILRFWEIYIRLIPWHCPIQSLHEQFLSYTNNFHIQPVSPELLSALALGMVQLK